MTKTECLWYSQFLIKIICKIFPLEKVYRRIEKFKFFRGQFSDTFHRANGAIREGISRTYSTPKPFQAATAGLVSAELRTIQSQHAIKTWKDLYQHQ